ncbi:Gly-X carboxypeptidase [Kwoniella heveanensis CBS 569]|uniref:Gly-X carboxypeptidase n=1 Tax=Kwoniella heveanensis BCC8398 TaxID=1296120 RepID=A0A1B9H0Q4_9TREE|nr:Gly-X carboxypeptidase [Kwoniella heveanensis BCC8398]OCF40362.1 Gly-X carboxypeptidase [Kwoniella heveanensis CBS 569]
MSSLEKRQEESLPLTSSLPPQPAKTSRPSIKSLVAHFSLLAALVYLTLPYLSNIVPSSGCHSTPKYDAATLEGAKCPHQPKALNVGTDWDPLTDKIYGELAAKRLSKAVQINTESYDNFPKNASDPVFDKHYAFAHFIENEYTKLYTDIKHETVNVHGHLFTWEGSNKSLKPILLMAHIDTVPVLPATLDQWTYPPFEGTVTHDATPETPGTWVWGRGSSDCKNSLLGIYGAVERLITEGFQPERTIIIANGFDEEIGGFRGAGALAKTLYDRYGDNGISFLVDEGFTGLSEEYGSLVASFGMAEKGAVNVAVKVETLGGHSSVPPPHTAIGITSLLLAELEAHPFKPALDPAAPYLKYLNCLSDYAPEFPKALKGDVKNPRKWKKLARELAGSSRILNSFLSTTQAIDLISGGVKVNALPEVVEATVNYRISFTSSVNETISHVAKVLKPLAKDLGFTISAFESDADSIANKGNSTSHITLTVPGGTGLEPAPITSATSEHFELLAGTAKHVFGEKTIVSPSGMFANTDTRHFWNLTEGLYRFTPALVSENLNQHTVDERISLEGHLNTTRFFYKLIRNSEGWQAE